MPSWGSALPGLRSRDFSGKRTLLHVLPGTARRLREAHGGEHLEGVAHFRGMEQLGEDGAFPRGVFRRSRDDFRDSFARWQAFSSRARFPHCLMIKDADEEAEISLVPHQIKWS